MKKLIVITALSCLLLTGCGSNNGDTTTPSIGTTAPSAPTVTVPQTTAPTESTVVPSVPTVPTTQPQSISFEVYFPDEDYVEFLHKSVTLEALTAEAVLLTLIRQGVVDAAVTVRDAHLDGTQLNLDLSVDFLEQLRTLGSTGERFVVGSVVNSFLSAYGAESVMILVEGDLMETGHVVYDAPMTFFS